MRFVYFVMRYPSATQTFIEREMFALAKGGCEIEVRPIWDFRVWNAVPGVELPARVYVRRLGAIWHALPKIVFGVIGEVLRRPTLLLLGLKLLVKNIPRHAEGWFMTIWGTLVGLALARDFRAAPPDVFHGAWATAPATTAAVLAELCGRPFSFGAHAYDIHRHGGDPLLGAKLRSAGFVHTTTQANVDYLTGRFPDRRAPIELARRGLSSEAFAQAGEIATARSSRRTDTLEDPSREYRLLSVGRLVEKKGHTHQIAACAELRRRVIPVRLRIIGDGPLRAQLEAQIAAAGLAHCITLDGARAPHEVWPAYAWADAFWHTGIVDAQGDRDGLPNVIPEAMACELPVISTVAGGAGEAIINDVNGLVVTDPSDSSALADAVARLADDPKMARKLGQAARVWVRKNFLAEENTKRLAAAFAAAASGGARDSRMQRS